MFGLLKRAPKRFMRSFGYSWNGLKATFTKEESFRLETIAFSVLALVMASCDWPLWKKAAMLASFLVIPMMEILNSAIEDICDLITPDHNRLVKNAKDKGALAVLFAIILNALVLAALLVA